MTLPLTQAFLEQAKADYTTYNIIRSHPNQPSSQWLHLSHSIEFSGKITSC